MTTTFTPRPCQHCHGVSFHVVPNLRAELYEATSFLGIQAGKDKGWLSFSLVICAQCSHTEMFTTNGPDLVQKIPGVYMAHAR
jgi:hypothetical protein